MSDFIDVVAGVFCVVVVTVSAIFACLICGDDVVLTHAVHYWNDDHSSRHRGSESHYYHGR